MKVEVRNSATNGFKNGGGRFIRYLLRRARDIREGGVPVLLRKVRTFLVMVPAALVVLMVRALRPLVVIRFGRLYSTRIGHFALSTMMYLCERDAGMHGQRTLDIFYITRPLCNHQLKTMWDRTLRVYRFARSVARVNRLLPGYEQHVVQMPPDRDIYSLLARTRVHLSFTLEEERLGCAGLRELGIPDGAAFVCFTARESAYMNALFPGGDSSYHDYRNSSIHNYLPAAEELARRGYFAIRMGAIVQEALATTNPMIIDYATSGRTDFLDIFLGAKCRFFICDTAGISSIATIFRRPIAWVNYVPLEYAPTGSAVDLFIPKKLWLREERRFLTFREILNSGVGSFIEGEKYEQLGIEVIENNPEEITALAVEMDERVKGTWQTTEDDEELQRRFWSLFKPSKWHGTFVLRIGEAFLRQNQGLLG